MGFGHSRPPAGFTLIEVVVGIAVLLLIGVAVSAFQSDVFVLNRRLGESLEAQNEARSALKYFGTELRAAAPASTGAYPLADAQADSVTFYSDLDDDGRPERIRYAREGSFLRKGTLSPTGDPPTYEEAAERVKVLVHDVANAPAEPVFTYYGAATEGAEFPPPLADPSGNIQNIRRVQLQLVIDKDGGKPPAPVQLSTQVTVRNLRDAP